MGPGSVQKMMGQYATQETPKMFGTAMSSSSTSTPIISASAPSSTYTMTAGARRKKVSKKKMMMDAPDMMPKKRVSKKKDAKGGSLMSDVRNLAVPFAILLAKQGLDSMFEKKKVKKGGNEEGLGPDEAMRIRSERRRSTIAGGSCGSQCAAVSEFANMTGGRRMRNLNRPFNMRGGNEEEDFFGPGEREHQEEHQEGGARKKKVAKAKPKAKPKRKSKKSMGGAEFEEQEEQEAGSTRASLVKTRFEKLSQEIDNFLKKY
jgi:hypothetical protein